MPDEEMDILRILVAEELEIPATVLELDTDLREWGLDCNHQAELARDIEEMFYLKFGDEEHLTWFTIRSVLKALRERQQRMRRSGGYRLRVDIDDLYESILEVVADRLGIPVSELYLDTDLQGQHALTIYDQAEIAGTLEVALSASVPRLDIGCKEHMSWRTPRDILMTFQLAEIICTLAPF